MPNLPGTAALAALGAARSGAAFVKVGLYGVSTEDDAVALLRAVRDGVARWRARWSWPAAYADARRVAHAPLAPELLPRVAHAAGVGVCLLDTAVKDGRGLLDWLSPDALTALVAEAHAAGLQVALAGALRAEDLPVIRDPAPTSPACARPSAAAAGARRRSSRRASALRLVRRHAAERRTASIEQRVVRQRCCARRRPVAVIRASLRTRAVDSGRASGRVSSVHSSSQPGSLMPECCTPARRANSTARSCSRRATIRRRSAHDLPLSPWPVP